VNQEPSTGPTFRAVPDELKLAGLLALVALGNPEAPWARFEPRHIDGFAASEAAQIRDDLLQSTRTGCSKALI
jgi:hypothetical protein